MHRRAYAGARAGTWQDAGMREPPAVTARSYGYRLAGRLPPGAVRDVALRVAAPVLRSGPVSVGNGLGRGLLIGTDALGLDHVQGFGLVRGLLEPAVQEALRRHVAPGAVVWDVGANLGFFSLLAARLGAGRVEAFEPVAANAAAVRANAARNGYDGVVHVHEAAMGAADGRASLHVVGDEASWSHLADRGRHPGTTATLEVAVVRGDGLVASRAAAPPAVVKVDVEGSELDVLRGMTSVLAEHRPVLVVETHETNAELVALLDAAGYACENLDGPEPVASAGPVHVLARAR
jgi:FkbM family methyltransferase